MRSTLHVGCCKCKVMYSLRFQSGFATNNINNEFDRFTLKNGFEEKNGIFSLKHVKNIKYQTLCERTFKDVNVRQQRALANNYNKEYS